MIPPRFFWLIACLLLPMAALAQIDQSEFEVPCLPPAVSDTVNGFLTLTNSEGGIDSEGHYVDGYPDGLFKFYHQNGKKKAEGHFSKGSKNGFWKDFHQSTGKQHSEGRYVNCLQEGSWKYYHTNGRIKMEVRYRKGEETGKRKLYDKRGKLISF